MYIYIYAYTNTFTPLSRTPRALTRSMDLTLWGIHGILRTAIPGRKAIAEALMPFFPQSLCIHVSSMYVRMKLHAHVCKHVYAYVHYAIHASLHHCLHLCTLPTYTYVYINGTTQLSPCVYVCICIYKRTYILFYNLLISQFLMNLPTRSLLLRSCAWLPLYLFDHLSSSLCSFMYAMCMYVKMSFALQHTNASKSPRASSALKPQPGS